MNWYPNFSCFVSNNWLTAKEMYEGCCLCSTHHVLLLYS